MCAIDSGFITAAVGTASGLIGVFIGSRLARSTAFAVIDLQEFNKAAATFRAAFVDAMFHLRKNAKDGEERAGEILNAHVVIPHEKAKIMFEPFLSSPELESFNAAWEKYRYSERNYTENQDDKSFRKILSQRYLNHIDVLLKYAELKIST